MPLAERFVDALLTHVVFLICVLPLIGAALTLLSARLGTAHVRSTAMTNSLLTLALSLLMAASYKPSADDERGRLSDIQMASYFRWIGPKASAEENAPTLLPGRLDIRFAVGVDGVSLWPIVLTSLLSAAAVAGCPSDDRRRPAAFYALLLIEQSLVTCLFAALDVVLFALCLQLTLVPMFFLIGVWGSYERRPAARRFLLHNLAGSLLVTLGLVSIALIHGDLVPPLTFAVSRLTSEFPAIAGGVGASDWSTVAPWILFALIAGLAVRVPAVGCHTWFVPATVEAPLPAGLLLAGLFPLTGLYGLVRFAAPLLQDGESQLTAVLQAAAICGAIYFGLLALAQMKLKPLAVCVCLSAIHLAAAGVLSRTAAGTTGGLLYACAIALSISLFLLAVRQSPAESSGDSISASASAIWRTLAALALIGIPGSAGFAGAVLILMGLIAVSVPLAVGGLLAWLLVACAVVRSMTGESAAEDRPAAKRFPESATLIALLAVIVWIGLYPQFFTSRIEASVSRAAGVFSEE